MAKLRIISHGVEPHEFELQQTRYDIGRSSRAMLRIDYSDVSRFHAQIERINGVFVLTDLHSANGTWVNHVAGNRFELHDADLIRLGTVELVFEDEVERKEKTQSQRLDELRAEKEACEAQNEAVINDQELGYISWRTIFILITLAILIIGSVGSFFIFYQP